MDLFRYQTYIRIAYGEVLMQWFCPFPDVRHWTRH